MSTAEFAETRAADANRPVPICSPLWGEEELSTSCPSARFDVVRANDKCGSAAEMPRTARSGAGLPAGTTDKAWHLQGDSLFSPTGMAPHCSPADHDEW